VRVSIRLHRYRAPSPGPAAGFLDVPDLTPRSAPQIGAYSVADPYTRAMVLDGGAEGIIAPYYRDRGSKSARCGCAVEVSPLKSGSASRDLAGRKAEPELESLYGARRAVRAGGS